MMHLGKLDPRSFSGEVVSVFLLRQRRENLRALLVLRIKNIHPRAATRVRMPGGRHQLDR
jgi:hypothetical protein